MKKWLGEEQKHLGSVPQWAVSRSGILDLNCSRPRVTPRGMKEDRAQNGNQDLVLLMGNVLVRWCCVVVFKKQTDLHSFTSSGVRNFRAEDEENVRERERGTQHRTPSFFFWTHAVVGCLGSDFPFPFWGVFGFRTSDWFFIWAEKISDWFFFWENKCSDWWVQSRCLDSWARGLLVMGPAAMDFRPLEIGPSLTVTSSGLA